MKNYLLKILKPLLLELLLDLIQAILNRPEPTTPENPATRQTLKLLESQILENPAPTRKEMRNGKN